MLFSKKLLDRHYIVTIVLTLTSKLINVKNKIVLEEETRSEYKVLINSNKSLKSKLVSKLEKKELVSTLSKYSIQCLKSKNTVVFSILL